MAIFFYSEKQSGPVAILLNFVYTKQHPVISKFTRHI